MSNPSLNSREFQGDMRHAYFGGATGLLASATVWLVAGIVAVQSVPKHAVLALFVGGMFIFPAGLLLAKLLGRPGSHVRGNPLGALALEGTIQFLLCLPLAYVIFLHRAEWFFPAMLLVIGGRYLTFATIYGMRVYWACGGGLALAGILLVMSNAAMPAGAFAGSAIEAVFAVVVFAVSRREKKS